jgi:glycosyltransferase involved in cell wall biosynthesis
MFNPNRKQKIESSSYENSESETMTDDLANNQETKSEKPQIFKNEKKTRTDPVQILLTATIFIFLAGMIYFILGPISMVAMGLGGGLSVYHMLSAKRKMFSKHQGRRGPSVFLLVLILSPFLMGGLVAYEGATLLESPTRIILLWAMTISFWTTMLFVPMSVLSKKRENLQPELKKYPRVSVIIPAYNEEKVIKKTLESMIETHYPRKEIIFVDDGSTDNTLEIARQFRNKITVLNKDNGGKASALNYGLVYAKGEIIVVVDADTIIGRNSLREIVKGFEIDEDVAAVAGNIKVRNRVNWITKCQALEYLIGIQVIRRAFDAFGSITVVPGALGAFKKSFVSDTGAYEKETIVEDFDQTIKLLKAGLITQGSVKAVAYTEAPDTLTDFAKQRKRWYRGNIQVLKKHSDALINPRFGYLQKLALPYLFLGMIITPIIGFTALANVVLGILSGDGWWVLEAAGIFMVVHFLMSALAIRIDDEDPKLLLYSGFLLFGFKQIVDFLLLKAIVEQLMGKKATWTSARRIGD